MADFDKYQLLTLFFGGIILLNVILTYQGTVITADSVQKALVEYSKLSLPFLFVAYSILTVEGAKGRDLRTYKMIVNAVGIISLAFVLVQPKAFANTTEASVNTACGSDKWCKVTGQVLKPLAQGAIFALPLINF